MKRAVLCLSALMMMGLFTGCGGNDDKTESGTTTTTTTTTTAAATTTTEAGTTTTREETTAATTDDGSLMSDLGDAGENLMSDTESIISNAGDRMR